MLVDQHHLGEGRQVEKLVDGLTVLNQSTLFFSLARDLRTLAERQMACQALVAMAAKCRQTSDHVVAFLNIGDI